MADDADIPPLPSFLDRKTWTAEQWRASERRAQEMREAAERELEAIALRACAAKEAKKAKEAMDAQRALDRAATAQRREAKRLLKKAALHAVMRELDKGPQTANALRQVVAEDKKSLVPWALRTMLKKGEIEKVSRQGYRRVKK